MKGVLTYKNDMSMPKKTIKGAADPQVALEKTLFSDVGDI